MSHMHPYTAISFNAGGDKHGTSDPTRNRQDAAARDYGTNNRVPGEVRIEDSRPSKVESWFISTNSHAND